MELINTLLGFALIQLYDILNRNKSSESTPEKFSVLFFIKDTWQKIIVSLFLSITLAVIMYSNLVVKEKLLYEFGNLTFDLIGVLYVLIGAVPELLLQHLKKRFGFLQPNTRNEE